MGFAFFLGYSDFDFRLMAGSYTVVIFTLVSSELLKKQASKNTASTGIVHLLDHILKCKLKTILIFYLRN